MDATHTPEEWRPVVGWEGSYEVSDQGRVRSIDRQIVRTDGQLRRFKGQLKTLYPGRQGYLVVQLCAGPLTRNPKVHLVVAEAFLGPRVRGVMVLHYNDIRTDNRLANLRYGTAKENGADKARNGRTFNGNKTHCKWGHEYTPENTAVKARRGSPHRQCIQCRRAQDRRQKALIRAAAKKQTSQSTYPISLKGFSDA